jgi:uncharacterized membrane protein YeiB
MHNNRIVGYDLARALSLFGMVLINYWVLMEDHNSDPQWLSNILEIIQGRAAALFVVLAGIGISLLSRQAYVNRDTAALRTVRHSLMKRALFLFVIGLMNSTLWHADILRFYGVYFVIGAFLLGFPSHRLAALIILPVAVFSILSFMVGFDRNCAWKFTSLKDFLDVPGMFCHLIFSGQYPVFPWLAFLITGMWLGRQNLHARGLRWRCLIAGLGAFASSEILSRVIFHISSHDQCAFDVEELLLWMDIDPWEPMPLFVFSAIGTSLCVIIFSITLAERFKNSGRLLAFSALGRYTLTLYVAHILLGWILLQFMDLFGWHTYSFTLWGSLLFYMIGIFFVHQWSQRHERGPLEWAMRRFALDTKKPGAAATVEV